MNVNTVNFGDIIKEISHGLMAESYISDNEFTKPCEYLSCLLYTSDAADE